MGSIDKMEEANRNEGEGIDRQEDGPGTSSTTRKQKLEPDQWEICKRLPPKFKTDKNDIYITKFEFKYLKKN